ncbi:MAG TPA: DnaT-like ssDNA-binding protein [Allosphingosinicella sp.]|jgi:hypothetical protein|uniref:DnaT-like ssDNA-binding protein n=1 Tax=Allosphingosinicella sp. TaxID=2823234 RepID=UPI002F27FDF4
MNVPEPTVGLNTYISVANASAVAANRLQADEWRAAIAAHEAATAAALQDTADNSKPLPESPPTVPAECRQALATATATLDRLKWAGTRASASQTLAWPRRRVLDRDGQVVPANVIPPAIATACAELAFFLLARGRDPSGNAQTQMRMIGQSMETYFASVSDELPTHVGRLIEPFLEVRSRHSAELLF